MPVHPDTIQIPMVSPSVIVAAACVVGLSLARPVRIGVDRARGDGATTAVTPARDDRNDGLRFDGHDGFYATVELVSVCEEPVDRGFERYTLMMPGVSQRPGSVSFQFVSAELRLGQVGDLFTAHLRPICNVSGRIDAAGSIVGCVDHPDVVYLSVVDLVPIAGGDRRRHAHAMTSCSGCPVAYHPVEYSCNSFTCPQVGLVSAIAGSSAGSCPQPMTALIASTRARRQSRATMRKG